MSNLKKVLATVLAVAMLLSMGLTAGAGVFTDVKDTDDYARAINLLASLDVLKGMGDDTYNAAGTYTREQFAKILYVLMNGKDDLASIYSGTSPFADVTADRWSAGYITWAKNAKVINGREDGLFWPTDIVTYAEAAKMFVVAMGYDSTVYTFPYGFIDKAQTLKLFDDVAGMTANGPANRGTVAQMTFNALFAEAPRFGTYAAQIGSSSTTETRTFTVAAGAFGMKEATSQLLGTSTNAGGESFTDFGQVQLAAFGSGTTLSGQYDYDGDVDAYIGAKVVVWYKPAKSSSGTGADSKEKLFDIQPATSNKIYDITSKDVKTSSSKTYDKDTGDTTVLTFAWNSGTKEVKVDNTERAVLFDGDDGALTDAALFKGTGTSKGDAFRLVDWEGDGFIDLVLQQKTATAKVTGLDKTRVVLGASKPSAANAGTFTGSKDLKDGDVEMVKVASDIAKNDYAIVKAVKQYTDKGMQTIYVLTKAAELESIKLNKVDQGDFYFGGTVYTVGTESGDTFEKSDVGNKYDLVLNANGYIVFTDETATTVSSEKWFFAIEAQVVTLGDGVTQRLSSITGYLADGTKKTYPVASDIEVDGEEIDRTLGSEPYYDDSDTSFGYAEIADDVIFQYTLNSSGELSTLKTTGKVIEGNDDYVATAGTDVEYSATSTKLTGVSKNGYVTEDTVIFYLNDTTGKYKVFKGDTLKKIEDPGYDVVDGIVNDDDVMVMFLFGDTSAPTKTTEKYVYLVNVIKEATDDDEYVYTFFMYYDGELHEIQSDETDDDAWDSLVDDETKGIYKLELDASGLVDEITASSNYEAILVTSTRGSSITGKLVEATDIDESASDAAHGLDYEVNKALTAENTVDELADDVYYYQVSDYPVSSDGGEIGVIDNDGIKDTVTVGVDSSVMSMSGTTLSYVAILVFNADGDEITNVFYFDSPIASYVAP
ncbi:MAG TPA: S-layer homology domain-containing protein [Candidatus Acidoferrum sp.]|nr:S-layer homology domain-containing protein [Candidatus Acidoferrum sp.]